MTLLCGIFVFVVSVHYCDCFSHWNIVFTLQGYVSARCIILAITGKLYNLYIMFDIHYSTHALGSTLIIHWSHILYLRLNIYLIGQEYDNGYRNSLDLQRLSCNKMMSL